MNIPGIFDPNCNSADAHNGFLTWIKMATFCFTPGKSHTYPNSQGCGLNGPPNSGGPAFNAGDGGVFATKWTSEGIKMFLGFKKITTGK